MDINTALEVADMIFRFAVVPLVVVLWRINGRLSTIEGRVEVIVNQRRR